jgi:hypothetical protein
MTLLKPQRALRRGHSEILKAKSMEGIRIQLRMWSFREKTDMILSERGDCEM